MNKLEKIGKQKNYQNIYYPESRFGGFTDLDGIIAFFTRVNALLQPSYTLLDIGCGRGAYAEDEIPFRSQMRIFKDKCKKVIGIDVDPVAKDNPFIDEFYLIKNGVFPLKSNSMDMAVCASVLEHVDNIDQFFSECQRVISRGGYLCILAPNKISYTGIVTYLIPNKFHDKILKKVMQERKKSDTFHTYYKCNTLWKLRKVLNNYGFDAVVYGYESEPRYLSFSHFLYWIGVMHQKFSPKICKPAIFAFAKKM